MDIEIVFERIGEFGPAQKRIFFLSNLGFHWFVAFQTLIIAFIGKDPDWSCIAPQKDPTKQSQLLFGSIDPLACELVESGQCTPDFKKDFTSIVTEWNLICSKSNLPNLSQSSFFVGSLLGAWIWGTLADMYGRRTIFFLTSMLLILSGIGTALSFSYYSFTFFRLCSGMSAAGTLLTCYVLCLEIVGKSGRKIVGIVGSTIFSLSFPLLSILAYFIRNWRLLTLLISASNIVVFALIRVLPESPRWLLVNGKTAEARSVLESIAKGNRTVMPMEELEVCKSGSAGKDVSMTDLFKGRVSRNRTLKLFVIWFTVSLVYYGLTMSSGDLGGNKYISFSLSGLVELPALFLSFHVLNYVGRRWTHTSFLLMTGAACLLYFVLNWAGNSWNLGPAVAFFGKFAVSAAFCVMYLYTAELYPTQVRNIGLGLCSVGARLGGILSPIVLLSTQNEGGLPVLPMLLMGSLGLGAGLLSISLPETVNQPMLDTLADLENQPY